MVRHLRLWGAIVALGLFGLGRAEVITMTQTPAMNTALMNSQGYYFLQNAVVNGWTPDGDAQRIDLSFLANAGRFGQNLSASPADWSGTNLLTCVLQNTQSYGIRLAFMMSTNANSNDFTNGYYCEFVLPANSTNRYAFYFQEPTPPNAQMKILPKPFDGNFVRVNCNLNTNLSNVMHWRFVNMASSGGRIILSQMRKVQYSLTMTGVVDQFFQYTERDWTGKIFSQGDLQTAANNEDADLTAHPSTGELNGATSLPLQSATGRWRTAKYNNRWYFVTPTGRLFWSFGLNGVHDMMSTKIAGREAMFQDIPARNGPNSDLYWTPQGTSAGELYSVVRHNLRLKYPGETNLRQKFLDVTNRRLDSWGVNTVSASALTEFYDNSRPYVKIIRTEAFPVHVPTPTTAWVSPPDVFDPTFQSWATAQFATALTNDNGKSNFLGVFVDNEMSWGHTLPNSTLIDRYSIALGILAAPANQPAKAEMIRMLTRKYRTVARLNTAWRRNFVSLNAMNTPLVLDQPSQITSSMAADFEAFQYRFASAYFTKVRAALNASGCTGLYLGCRFWHQVPEVLSACSQSVDVMSFNNYASVDDYNWPLLDSMRKPVLISEWSVNIDEGGSLGPVSGITRTERNVRMKAMFQKALTERNIIGLHWFELYDMPTVNRGHDIENYGTGIVDVTDTPHMEAVDAFRWAATNMYVLRR